MDPGEPERDPGCDCDTPTLDRGRARPSSSRRVDGEEPGVVLVILGVFDVPTPFLSTLKGGPKDLRTGAWALLLVVSWGAAVECGW